ncbi:MAG TPA: AAA family ATPase [Ktedonobacteraceae bacterium]|nr:AAA family ATPase [Ktedonobacteraceae bacterium]
MSSIHQNPKDIPQILSARDIMSKTFEPIRYAVPELLPMGLIILAGRQKTGKSWMDLGLCKAVAEGSEALAACRREQSSSHTSRSNRAYVLDA